MDVQASARNLAGPYAKAAVAEIEKCVHCGFCTAACPTYGLDRNELDSPRGRIYLVKLLLEDKGDPDLARRHLDLCLSCRSCETACPSGVGYSMVAQHGRDAAQSRRTFADRCKRFLLGELARSSAAGRLGRACAKFAGPLAPRSLRRSLAASPAAGLKPPAGRQERSVAVLAGCAQQGLMPESNRALALLLDAAGYRADIVPASCCGAVRNHTGRHAAAAKDMRRTVAACAASVEAGAEAVVAAASGCGSFMTEYRSLLDTPQARKVAGLVVDPASFLLARLESSPLAERIAGVGQGRKIALHMPCTLTNGLASTEAVPAILAAAGFDVAVPEAKTNCCGSAGLYSMLNPSEAGRLGTRTAAGLEGTGGMLVVSSNIGCIWHLRKKTALPVHHWLDLVAHGMAAG